MKFWIVIESDQLAYAYKQGHGSQNPQKATSVSVFRTAEQAIEFADTASLCLLDNTDGGRRELSPDGVWEVWAEDDEYLAAQVWVTEKEL